MKALLVVDMENDFMPGGALGIKGGDEIVPLINELIPKFLLVVASKDWHPPNHCSFASSHPGKKVGDVITIEGVPQILWPVHCVRNTLGAEFTPELDREDFAAIFYKGTDSSIDSYSAFYDNARKKSTGLTEFLKSRNVTEIYIAGLTTEYCVCYSALDAMEEGFQVTIILDACRGINLHPHDVEEGLAKVTAKGGRIISSSAL
jgi:nicotinamidase/pyrazinamidase